MPTYEYRCFECEKHFEKFQSISEPSLSECVYCGGRVERLISGGSGLLFRGSGFHITDYRSASYKKEASKEKEAGTKVKTASAENKPAKSGKTASGDG
jgi:putative FmdB family regulatory protein